MNGYLERDVLQTISISSPPLPITLLVQTPFATILRPLSTPPNDSCTHTVSLSLSQWSLLLLFNLTTRLFPLKISKSYDTLDEVMIGELLIGFRRIIDFDFTINDEAWLRPSALNKLQKSGLIFSEWNDARSDRLGLEPGFAERDLEDAFFESGRCSPW